MPDETRELVCIEEDHYLHVGENGEGQPCNSSVAPCWMQDMDGSGWSCLGCGCWWPSMPKMEPEGLAALRYMRPRDDEEDL